MSTFVSHRPGNLNESHVHTEVTESCVSNVVKGAFCNVAVLSVVKLLAVMLTVTVCVYARNTRNRDFGTQGY